MASDTTPPGASSFTAPKGGLFGGPFDSSGLDPNVRAILMDFRWTTTAGGPTAATQLSYSFPQQATDYTKVAGYPSTSELASFQPLTDFQKLAVKTAFDQVASYTNLSFVEVQSSDAAFRFARYAGTGSEARFPANNGRYQATDSRETGDNFLGGNGNPPSANFFGTDHYATIAHEMGHSFGLKHGHDGGYNGALSADRNDNEFSIMTYASYLGAPTGAATEARVGSSPQSFMMYDIAALQALYGANFSKAGTIAVYTWSATTGQEFINGIAATATGTTATNKIFSTVWTQGAMASYDLRNFGGDQIADLRPGEWLKFSQGQLADLNSDAAAGTAQYMAKGNIYNALQYNGDARSLVNNITTGAGNDKITGNAANNKISAGDGDDTISGGGGHDTVTAGAGHDSVDLTDSKVTLHDSLADMTDDTITGADDGDSLDFTGLFAHAGDVSITRTSTTVHIEIGGVSVDMQGHFDDGELMVTTRGNDADGHTTVTFAHFMPTLSEGQPVDMAKINGVDNDAFLTGDGVLQFSVQMVSAQSAFANTLGVYRVAADGTIHDVHVLFGNTLATNPGATVDLGTPANGEEIGFFLIQDGAHLLGNLPNDLAFLVPGVGAGNVDHGAAPVLFSATRGVLEATIFHSFAGLNPGGAEQVLSGIVHGAKELTVAFEDLPSGKGDNDFQDVVVKVHVSGDGTYFV